MIYRSGTSVSSVNEWNKLVVHGLALSAVVLKTSVIRAQRIGPIRQKTKIA